MKKIVMFMIAAFMTFLLIACSDSQTHDGEAKTPSASGAQKEGIISQLLKILKNVDLQTYR